MDGQTDGMAVAYTRYSIYYAVVHKNQSGFIGARDSEWQWHQLCRMQVCTSPQTDNDASTPLISFLQPGCPSACPVNSVKALKAVHHNM